MIRLSTMTLKADWSREKNRFFVWTEDENEGHIPPEQWGPLVFSWHELTFFGTMLDAVEIDGKQGVELSPWTALDFFARAPLSSLAKIEWSDKAAEYRRIAERLFQNIKDGAFMPDYEGWKTGQWRWKSGDDPFENAWLTQALADLMAHDGEINSAWRSLTEQYPLILSQENTLPLDEKTWLKRIGWKKDDTPFTVGLRLSEPVEDDDTWSLDILLRGKENPDEWAVYKKGEEKTLPKAWRDALDRVQEEEQLWLRAAPWLGDADWPSLSETEAWRFLTDASLKLAEAGTEILLPSWWKELQATNPKLKMKVKSSVGSSMQTFVGLDQLIQFDWKLATGGLELSESEFRRLVEENRRLVRIRGKWIKLDPAFVKRMQAIMKKVNEEGLSFADVLTKELLGDEAASESGLSTDALEEISLELNRHLESMISQLIQTKEVPDVSVPAEFNGELRPYQKKGMEWLVYLRRHRLGALLADDMGLGKTVQTIAYFLAARETFADERPMLIVCPTSVLGNWQKECQRFAPGLNVKLHYGSNRATEDNFANFARDADIVITSYNLSHIDEPLLTSVHWQTVCLDEAQNIKNVHTLQAKAVKKLKADHKIALTGTPIENRLTELWSIFDFLNPGYLGSLNRFRERFVIPIEKDNDETKIRQVQQLIRPFFMRRTKRDPDVELNLPDKQEQKEYCPLTAEQASLYEQIIEDTFQEIESRSGIERSGYVLSMLTKLKQVCDHPALYLKEEKGEKLIDRSHKIEKLVELVTSIRERNESCLIFTQYIGMGNMIQSLLSETLGEPVSFLHGGVRQKERDRMIDRFQKEKDHIIVLSLKAGGTGLNLTAANHVIHYDRWWNPAVENQATDRAYRIGQKRFVHVHKLITTGTLEEKIDEMIERKQSLSNEIIQSENWITELPDEELRELFTLRHDE